MKLMKRILPLMLVAVLLLAACGGRGTQAKSQATPDVAKLAEDMKNAVKLDDELMTVGNDVIKNLYEYDADSIAQYAVYTSSTMSTPEEIAVFVAKDDKSVDYIDQMIQLRVQNLNSTFKDYAPKEMPKIENAKVLKNGRYMALVVCTDPAPAEKVFNKAFS